MLRVGWDADKNYGIDNIKEVEDLRTQREDSNMDMFKVMSELPVTGDSSPVRNSKQKEGARRCNS